MPPPTPHRRPDTHARADVEAEGPNIAWILSSSAAESAGTPRARRRLNIRRASRGWRLVKSVPMKTTSCRRSPNSPSNGCRSATYASLACPSACRPPRAPRASPRRAASPARLSARLTAARAPSATLRCWVSSRTAPFDRSTRANVPSLAPSASAASAAAPGAERLDRQHLLRRQRPPAHEVDQAALVEGTARGVRERREAERLAEFDRCRVVRVRRIGAQRVGARVAAVRCSCAVVDASVHAGSLHAAVAAPSCECECAWSGSRRRASGRRSRRRGRARAPPSAPAAAGRAARRQTRS